MNSKKYGQVIVSDLQGNKKCNCGCYFNKDKLLTLLGQETKNIRIISPYVSYDMLKLLNKFNVNNIEITTLWDENVFKFGSSDIEIYKYCKENNIKLYKCNNLHSKIYISDNSTLIGSANFTLNGFGYTKFHNIETLEFTNCDIDKTVNYINSVRNIVTDDDYIKYLELSNEKRQDYDLLVGAINSQILISLSEIKRVPYKKETLRSLLQISPTFTKDNALYNANMYSDYVSSLDLTSIIDKKATGLGIRFGDLKNIVKNYFQIENNVVAIEQTRILREWLMFNNPKKYSIHVPGRRSEFFKIN